MATIVSLHAHPDDEALLCGGWLARRAALGDRVVLVVATDGDAGLAAPDQGGPNTLNLVFSGGGVIQLEIEGTSVFLQDFGEAWPTQWRPEHDKVPAK